MRSLSAVVLLAGLLGSAVTTALTAQVFPVPTQPQRSQQDSAQAADTIPVPPFRVPPPISPLGAFARSFIIPGWGQAVLGRRVTGAFFVFWEGLTLTMTVKASNQLSYLESVGDTARISAKRQEIQDWLVLLVFNHLVAGAEAFVSSYLWDFPVELEERVLPGGRIGIGGRVRY
jgi:hypothetical protein